MKDYFSHDYNSRNDTKLVRAGMKFGLCQAIGAYWCIVEMLYEEGGYLPLSEYERITFELRCPNELITYLINDSELFENDSEMFWSNTAIERLKLRASKSQKARESIEHRWDRKRNTNVHETNNERNTSKGKESEKENKEKEEESLSSAIAPTPSPKPSKFDFKAELIKIGVSEQVAADFLAVRRDKKATNTVTAFNAIRREILKANKPADTCIGYAVERGWKGFKSEWMDNAETPLNNNQQKQPSMREAWNLK